MYKLIKWAYGIGQKQERQRIKIAIQNIQREKSSQLEHSRVFLDRGEAKKARVESLQKQIELDEAVLQILGEMLHPHGRWVEEGTAPIDGGE